MPTITILVAEDDCEYLGLFCEFFPRVLRQQEGFRTRMWKGCAAQDCEVRVVVACDTDSAIELLNTNIFDYVVVDGTGWLQVALHARQRFPTVGYTGSSEALDTFVQHGVLCFRKGTNTPPYSKDVWGLAEFVLGQLFDAEP